MSLRPMLAFFSMAALYLFYYFGKKAHPVVASFSWIPRWLCAMPPLRLRIDGQKGQGNQTGIGGGSMACIVVTSGPCRGDRYPLGRRTNVIGRAESLPIQVLDDRVSRKHLQIRFDSATGRYLAADMNSRNGVFVNGDRLTATTLLQDRDRIRLGGTVLLFAQSDSDEDTMVWHRFKKAGERQRPTHFDLSVQGRPAKPPVLASRRRPLCDLTLIRDRSGVVYCI